MQFLPLPFPRRRFGLSPLGQPLAIPGREGLAGGPEVATLSPELLESQAGAGVSRPITFPPGKVDPVRPAPVVGHAGGAVSPLCPRESDPVRRTVEKLVEDSLGPMG